MTILQSLLDSIKMNLNQNTNVSDRLDYSKTSSNEFSRILDSANKSYNFTYENRVESFSEKDLLGNNSNVYNSNSYSQNQLYNPESYELTREYTRENQDYNIEDRKDYKPKSQESNWENSQSYLVGNEQSKNYTENPVAQTKEEVRPNNTAKDNQDTKEVKKTDEPAEKSTTQNVIQESSEKIKSKNQNSQGSTEATSVKADKEDLKSKIQLATTVDLKVAPEKNNSQAGNEKIEDTKQKTESKKTAASSPASNIVQDAAKSAQTVKKNPEPQATEQAENVSDKKVNQDTADKVKIKEKSEQVKQNGLAANQTEAAPKQTDIKPNQRQAETAKAVENQNTAQNVQAKTDSKPEAIVTESIKQTQPGIEKQNNSAEKIADKLSKITDDRPVVAKVEVQTSARDTNLSQQGKQELKGELKSGSNTQNLLNSDSSSINVNMDRTVQFGKILEANQVKQPAANSVMDQVLNKVKTDIDANKSEVTITLRPDNLGKVDINLVSVKGVLTAQITAENSQVRDILNKGLETLRQTLQEQGLNVDKLAVQVQEPSQTNNANNNHSNTQSESQKFEQAKNDSSKENQNSSKQTSGQSKNNNYASLNQEETQEESAQNPAQGDGMAQPHQGKVDYRV